MEDSLKLENQLCFPIYLTSKEIIKRYTPYLDEVNLTYTQYIVMLYLWEYGNSTLKEIGKKLILESGTLTPLLKKLELKGFILRKKSESDERNLDIILTSKGLKLKGKVVDIPLKVGKCLDLTEKEAINLYNVLYKILGNLERNDLYD